MTQAPAASPPDHLVAAVTELARSHGVRAVDQVLRQVSGTTIAVNGVRVDPRSRRAWHGDAELRLSRMEFDLLWFLVRNPDAALTREQLMTEVWGVTWYGSTKSLDMHIKWLRHKLGENGDNPSLITTVRGIGYRFEPGGG